MSILIKFERNLKMYMGDSSSSIIKSINLTHFVLSRTKLTRHLSTEIVFQLIET